jgi:aspartyl-tRNA(Asn)/glutamyl-tRNA(Gln) amidotransferase subunit C
MDHDKELVMKAAKLAKLSLTEKEIDVFAPQLKEIIKYVEKLNEVDVSNIEPTSHAISEIKNRFQDVNVDSQHLDISDALKNASKKDGRYFITEAVL